MRFTLNLLRPERTISYCVPRSSIRPRSVMSRMFKGRDAKTSKAIRSSYTARRTRLLCDHWAGVRLISESLDLLGYRRRTSCARSLPLCVGGSETRAHRMDAQAAACQREPPDDRQVSVGDLA